MSMNQLDISGANSTNLTFDHITYDSPHGCVSVERTKHSLAESSSTMTVLTTSRRRVSSGCLNEGRLGIRGRGPNSWVTVTNSHFGGNTLPGCSDGIQVGGHRGDDWPWQRVYRHLSGRLRRPLDPIQFYCYPPGGASNNIVTGNWFHGNTTGCMCWDGGDNMFTNNVFESIGIGRLSLAVARTTGRSPTTSSVMT